MPEPRLFNRSRESLGFGGEQLAELVEHWRTGFDWPAQEAWISALPWEQTELSTVPVRAVVSRAEAAYGSPSSPVVLLLHGWPDSILRFQRLFPLLTDLTYVAPALPGYPFAAPVPAGGMSTVEMADAIASAMSEFGFARYVVSAGDVGSDVAEALAVRHPDVVTALHLTDVSQYHVNLAPPQDMDDAEREYQQRARRWQGAEGGYAHEQSTRPVDAGGGAWGFTGRAGGVDRREAGPLDRFGRNADERVQPGRGADLDQCVLVHRVHRDVVRSLCGGPSDGLAADRDPTVFTLFPKDLVNAPRQFAERYFNVAGWMEFESGGHFAAWERPQQYLEGVRAAVKLGFG